MDYSAATVVDAWPGARSYCGIYNKPDSTNDIHLEQVVCTHSNPEADGFDLRYDSGPIGTVTDRVRNKVVGLPNSSTSELRWGNCVAQELPPNLIYEIWTGTRFKDGIYRFTSPFIIRPGFQVTLCAAHDNTYIVCTFEFKEVPIV